MKLKRNYIFCAMLGALLAFSSACGGASTTNSNANSSNSNKSANSNLSNQSANANTTVPTSDKPPITIEAGNITTSEFIDIQDSPGRIVTANGNLVFVSEGEKEIELNSAKTRAIGTPFNEVLCKGDFSKYTGIKDKIADATKRLSPPRATVKGTVAKEQNTEGTLILEPCVLADLKATP